MAYRRHVVMTHDIFILIGFILHLILNTTYLCMTDNVVVAVAISPSFPTDPKRQQDHMWNWCIICMGVKGWDNMSSFSLKPSMLVWCKPVTTTVFLSAHTILYIDWLQYTTYAKHQMSHANMIYKRYTLIHTSFS